MRFRSSGLLVVLFGASLLLAQPEERAAAATHEGTEALQAGDNAGAAAAFERAAELEPTRAEHWVRLGMARARAEQWDAAVAAYQRAIDLDPSAKTCHNLANVYFRRGDYDSAAKLYGRAVEIDPTYLLARFHYGWCLRQLNRAEEAQAAFEECLRLEPHDERERETRVDCLFGLGSMRHRAGDYAASARMMEQVLSVFPAHPEARYYLGMAYRQLGRLEDARRQLEIHAQIMQTHRKEAPIEKPLEEE